MKTIIFLLLLIKCAYADTIQIRAFGPSFDSKNNTSSFILISEEKLTKIIIELKASSVKKFEIVEAHGVGKTNAKISFVVIDDVKQSKLILTVTQQTANENILQVFAVEFDAQKSDRSILINEVNRKEHPELWRIGLELSNNGKTIEQIEQAVKEMKGRVNGVNPR